MQGEIAFANSNFRVISNRSLSSTDKISFEMKQKEYENFKIKELTKNSDRSNWTNDRSRSYGSLGIMKFSVSFGGADPQRGRDN